MLGEVAEGQSIMSCTYFKLDLNNNRNSTHEQGWKVTNYRFVLVAARQRHSVRSKRYVNLKRIYLHYLYMQTDSTYTLHILYYTANTYITYLF